MKVRGKVYAAVLSLIVGLVMLGGQAHAASVSYFLDQSNENTAFPDGVNYLKVTITEVAGGIDGNIQFTVEILPALTSIADTNFGIDKFAFNSSITLVVGNLSIPPDPNAWSANIDTPSSVDGFGTFNVLLQGPGNRQDPLTFTIDVAGDTLSTYDQVFSSGDVGNVLFAAHVAGFVNQDPDGDLTSAFFGGSAVVPIPPAVLLFGSGLVVLLGFTRRRRAARA